MLKTLKFATVSEANYKLAGGIVGGKSAATLFEGLVGLTLTFSSPAGYCTFYQPSGTPPGSLRFSDVKFQIESAVLGLSVTAFDGKLAITAAALGIPVQLMAADEVARPILGFANNSSISGNFLSAESWAGFAVEYGIVYVMVEMDSNFILSGELDTPLDFPL